MREGLVETNATGEFAGNLLLCALYGSSFLALAFLRGLFIKLTVTDVGKDTGFFTGTLETAQCNLEGFVIFYTYIWHTNSS